MIGSIPTHSPESTAVSPKLPIMTSNPNFADYVERVQENLAVFSLNDDCAKRYLMESNPLAGYNPRFIAFEILFNHRLEANKLERKFDPHVSDKLFEQSSLVACLKDLKRLYNVAKLKKIDLSAVDWSTPSYIENDEYLSQKTKDSLKKIPEAVKELDQLYESLKDFNPTSGSDENLEPETRIKLEKVKEILDYLLQKYEVQYIPTNVGTTALVYEAWKQGKLIPLGNPENDLEKFEQLISGLFMKASGKEYDCLVKDMAENLGLDNPRVRRIEHDKLSNQREWVGTPEGWEWFTCIESSLIHKLDKLGEASANFRYLIYYPLIIDDYWFAGVALIYSDLNVDPSDGDIPEIFNRKKYPKIYNTIKSVSDTLKLSLREEALKQAEKKLRVGVSKENVFLDVLKDYFVCFNVRKEGEENQSHSLKTEVIYEGNGVRLFGPAWLIDFPEKLELIKREIDGYDVGVRHVPGLYNLVNDSAQKIDIERDRAKDEGIEEQSQKFSHQGFGLMRMIWLDPEIKKINPRSRAALWHLKTLTQVLGKNLFEAEQPISKIDFPEWKDSTPGRIIQEVANLSLSHALERATLQRLASTEEDKKLINKINYEAFQILKREDRVDEFKRQIGLPSLIDESWPGWVTHQGFILCFHHVFWQAAFHAFRAACGQQPALNGTKDTYLKVIVEESKIEVRNVAVPQASGVAYKPRDLAFFEDINKVLKDYFEIEESTGKGTYWSSIISRKEKAL